MKFILYVCLLITKAGSFRLNIPKTNGFWSSWARVSESKCSISCEGPGKREVTLSRECKSLKPVHGILECLGATYMIFYEKCFAKQKCPVDGGWGSWTLLEVGHCSVTCGNGTENTIYSRFCNNPRPLHGGSYCPQSDIEVVIGKCHLPCPKYSFKEINKTIDIVLLMLASVLFFLILVTAYLLYRHRITQRSDQTTMTGHDNPTLIVTPEHV